MAGHRAVGARSSFLVLVVISAMVAAGCMGENDSAKGATTDTRPATTMEAAPETMLPPSGFSARPSPFSISLSWDAPNGEPEVDEYVLYRNGNEVESVDGATTAYIDHRLAPGKTYSYEIEARAGELVSDRTAIEARTPIPPLRAARVAGVFNVRTKELSASGYVEHSEPTYGWQFRPRCGEGTCDVRWNDLQRKRIRTVLNRRASRYRGTYTGAFNVLCSGAQVTSVVEIQLKVDAARPIAGVWRATRLTGTLNQSEAAQLGCVSSQARLSFRARLLR